MKNITISEMIKMKKAALILTGIIALIFIQSCETEKPVRFFELDGKRHDLYSGFMDDWGTNTSGIINTRYYAISFRSSDDFPRDYITFFIGSQDTERLEEGTYYYDFMADRGEFSDIRVGADIRYDSDGWEIDGIIFDEDIFDFDGVIRVSRTKYGKYDFMFDINMTVKEQYKDDYPQDVYNLYGEFNDRLILDTDAVRLDWY